MESAQAAAVKGSAQVAAGLGVGIAKQCNIQFQSIKHFELHLSLILLWVLIVATVVLTEKKMIDDGYNGGCNDD